MHPFLAKVTSDELLARAQAARGVRPRRRAVGGRQRDGVPGQRLLVVPDRRGRLREQPACLGPRRARHRARPARRAAADRGRAVRRARASRTPPSATSPTPRASCPAASTTTSTPRSRWSTRCCRPSRRSSSASTTRSWPATTTPAPSSSSAVRVSFEAIDQHPHEVAIFQNEADYLGGFERFGYLAERNAQSRNVWMTLLDRGRGDRRAAPRPRHRAHLPVHPRHRLGRGPVVPPRQGLSHDDIADQYLHILLDGIAHA